MNKFFTWLLNVFKLPELETPQIKFVEGTEWTCPVCDAVLTRALCDIYYGDSMLSADWSGQLHLGRIPSKHCGVPTIRRVGLLRQIHTPTGWVG